MTACIVDYLLSINTFIGEINVSVIYWAQKHKHEGTTKKEIIEKKFDFQLN